MRGPMAALRQDKSTARVVWTGRMVVPVGADLVIHGVATEAMRLGFAGPEDEVHAGLTRPSCGRVLALHPRGTEIANARQVSIVSAEELDLIAADLGLAAIDPAWLGAGLVVAGIPDFTHLPPSSRLQGPDGSTLVVDMENLPCTQVARTIERLQPGHGKAFKAAARDRRGVTAWVERPGVIRPGDVLRLFVPAQRPWARPG